MQSIISPRSSVYSRTRCSSDDSGSLKIELLEEEAAETPPFKTLLQSQQMSASHHMPTLLGGRDSPQCRMDRKHVTVDLPMPMSLNSWASVFSALADSSTGLPIARKVVSNGKHHQECASLQPQQSIHGPFDAPLDDMDKTLFDETPSKDAKRFRLVNRRIDGTRLADDNHHDEDETDKGVTEMSKTIVEDIPPKEAKRFRLANRRIQVPWILDDDDDKCVKDMPLPKWCTAACSKPIAVDPDRCVMLLPGFLSTTPPFVFRLPPGLPIRLSL